VRDLLKETPRAVSGFLLPQYTPVDEGDRTLVFESRFESGNLAIAEKVSE
jgi:hypothetical protein